MKKTIMVLFSCFLTFNVLAQLTVDVNGNVGIGDTLTSYNSQLCINGAGLNLATVYAKTTDRERGIYTENYTTNKDWTYGLYGKSYVFTKKHVGLAGVACISTPLATGRTFGVLGCASNATNGYNYGVYGGLDGTRNGGAIVGSIYHAWGFGYAIPDRYAGFFDGPVLATEAVTAPSFVVPSSTSNITNVSNLDSERSYQGIMSLTPIEYEQAYSMELEPEVADTISSETMAQFEKAIAEKKAASRPLFGLVAEDVQKIYPELVRMDSKGNLGVDYIGLIPLLIQTVQQLDAEVKALRCEGGIIKGMGPETGTGDFEVNLTKEVQISTNGSCEIEYTLSDAVKSAKLYIYSISGKLADSRVVNARGNGKLSVDTSKLSKGVYIYTLIADGQPISSRQMIVQ